MAKTVNKGGKTWYLHKTPSFTIKNGRKVVRLYFSKKRSGAIDKPNGVKVKMGAKNLAPVASPALVDADKA